MQKSLSTLVSLGQPSLLREELNKSIEFLFAATESHFQPHRCLNGEDGLQVLAKIAKDRDSDTMFVILPNIAYGGEDDLWINVSFRVFLDKESWPKHVVDLTPRQTSYIVQRLPPDFQQQVLADVKAWYLEYFTKNMVKSLENVARQWKEGGPLIADVHKNRIFDIHSDKIGHNEVPYTEPAIIGEALFAQVFYGATFLSYGQDGYAATDTFLRKNDVIRKAAVTASLDFLRPKI